MKQYEVFGAWLLVSKKHFQFIHLVEEISILLPFPYCWQVYNFVDTSGCFVYKLLKCAAVSLGERC